VNFIGNEKVELEEPDPDRIKFSAALPGPKPISAVSIKGARGRSYV